MHDDYVVDEVMGTWWSKEEWARRNRGLGESTAAEWKRKKDIEQEGVDRRSAEKAEDSRRFWRGGFLLYPAIGVLGAGVLHCGAWVLG